MEVNKNNLALIAQSVIWFYFNAFTFFSLELTQIEDPREQWRREQERMLKEYLIVAQEALNAKKEIYQIKQQRFELAQEEYQQLHKMCEDDSRSYASCESAIFSWFYTPALRRCGVRNSVKYFHHLILLWMKVLTYSTELQSFDCAVSMSSISCLVYYNRDLTFNRDKC